ncbi:MAG TPA: hypothetical protein VE987_13465, partial [Polyangiaceae bacterium]|nr:hypothetical protein [Polyangiaceae bacterium]
PGVLVQPGAKTIGVDIPMTTLLDHALDTMPMPPSGSPRGPDRLVSTLAVDLGSGQFAALPLGAVTTLLPISGPVSFIGVPALGGTLSGASYDLTEAAVTGESQSAPASVVAGVETTNANDPLAVTGFLPVPALIQPSAAAWTGTHVAMQASGPIDLAVVQISSGGGLVIWQIVAPGSDLSFDVPDLSQVPDVASLVHGPISTSFAVARIDSFDYGRLRYGHLSSAAWSAYALDTAAGSY